MINFRVSLIVFVLSLAISAIAQPLPEYAEQPEIGKPMPDFTLKNVMHYSKKQVSLKDFKGKWLILDFWAAFCAPCLKSFPKLSQLQKQFDSKVQIILVGGYGKFAGNDLPTTIDLYERLRKKQDLHLAVAYDSSLLLPWEIYSVPHFIFIDEEGIVRDRNNGINLNAETLQSLIERKIPQFDLRVPASQFDPQKLLLIDDNGGDDEAFLFRSILAKNTSQNTILPTFTKTEQIGGKPTFQLSQCILSRLYNYAYIGKYDWLNLDDSLHAKVYPEPILELKDSSLFSYDFDSGRGMYDYSVSFPSNFNVNSKYLMGVMQRDLKNYFGYNVSIETRSMPYWKLIQTSEGAKKVLKSEGGDGQYPGATAAGFKAKNISVKMLLKIIYYYHLHREPPFVDATGINYNIDISIDALMSDFEEVKISLRKNGLDLVKDEKEMKVIVIRDGDEF